MKKTILATAIMAVTLGLVACGEEAKAAGVTVYGQVDQQVQITDGVADVNGDDNYVGFKVSEDLGNGASAVANISMDIDTEGNNGSTVRDSYVGINTGDFSVTAGRMSNLTKQVTSGVVDIFDGASFGADGGARVDSVVAVNVGALTVASIADNGGEDKIDAFEVALEGNFGSVGLSAVYTEDKTTSATTKQIGATTDLAGLSVGATYEIADNDDVTVTAVASKDFGNNTLRGGIEDVENGDQTYIAEVAHNFSKSTAAYVNYSTDNNDATEPTTQVGLRMVF